MTIAQIYTNTLGLNLGSSLPINAIPAARPRNLSSHDIFHIKLKFAL